MNLKKQFTAYLSECFEGGFVVDEQNKQPMAEIFRTIETGKLGALIIGKTGSGKSIIFEALHRVLHPKSPLKFKIEQAQDIVHDYNVYGSEILNQFSVNRNFYIDDIGTEINGKYYGKDCNVIADLILIRYNIYKTYGAFTHFTTNLGIDQLMAKYGDRICSRLGEMCDTHFLDTTDRRQYRNFKGWANVIHPKGFTEEDKKWYEDYRKMQEYRRNMTPEQVEAENLEGRKNFMLVNNAAFQKYKEENGFTLANDSQPNQTPSS